VTASSSHSLAWAVPVIVSGKKKIFLALGPIFQSGFAAAIPHTLSSPFLGPSGPDHYSLTTLSPSGTVRVFIGGSPSPSGQPGLRTAISSDRDQPATSLRSAAHVAPGSGLELSGYPAQSQKKRCEQGRLPQGGPSSEPLVGAQDSRKEKPTKPNQN